MARKILRGATLFASAILVTDAGVDIGAEHLAERRKARGLRAYKYGRETVVPVFTGSGERSEE